MSSGSDLHRLAAASPARAGSNGHETAPRRAESHPRRALRTVRLLGTGAGIPSRVLANRELEHMVDTSDEWILTRTGVRERRIAAPGEATSDLATEAGRRALEQAGLAADALEFILVATVTPDTVCPPTTCLVQEKLGAHRAAGFDLNAACSGFQNALLTAERLIASGSFENALVIGADCLSRITDYEDRGTCILFGDAAGAALLAASEEGHEILDQLVGLDGTGHDLITMPAGGSARPASAETVALREHFLRLEGQKVFRFAVQKMPEVVEELTTRNGLSPADIDVLVPHQANLRIIDSAASRLGIPMDRVVVNVDRYGNTSAASVPVALDEAARTGRIRPGDLVCTVAFGGGLSWGATLIRW